VREQMNTFILGTLGLRLRSNCRPIVYICQHMSEVDIELSQAGLITQTLFIYLHPKKLENLLDMEEV